MGASRWMFRGNTGTAAQAKTNSKAQASERRKIRRKVMRGHAHPHGCYPCSRSKPARVHRRCCTAAVVRIFFIYLLYLQQRVAVGRVGVGE